MIYLASPYTSPDTQTEIRRYKAAREALDRLTAANLRVFSPVVIGHEMSKRGFKRKHDWWMAWCLAFLDRSTELYVLTLEDWDVSGGVRAEVQHAARIGLRISGCDILPELCEADITGAMIRKHFEAMPRPALAEWLKVRDDGQD